MIQPIRGVQSPTQWPVEPKVKAATATTYAATLLLTGIMAIIQDGNTALIIGFLPDWVEPFALALMPALLTFAAGYQARHQYRSDN